MAVWNKAHLIYKQKVRHITEYLIYKQNAKHIKVDLYLIYKQKAKHVLAYLIYKQEQPLLLNKHIMINNEHLEKSRNHIYKWYNK